MDALALFEELLDAGEEFPSSSRIILCQTSKARNCWRKCIRESPKTLTIMLTGQADREAVSYAVNHANLYRYIAKPWDPTDLALTVKEAMRRYFQDKTIAQQLIY